MDPEAVEPRLLDNDEWKVPRCAYFGLALQLGEPNEHSSNVAICGLMKRSPMPAR